MREKLLIIGPIGNQGGRAIEAHMIAQSLSEQYDVEVFLTIQSAAQATINHSKSYATTSLVDTVFNSSVVFKGLAKLAYIRNKRRGDIREYVGNALAKKYFSLEKYKKKIVLQKLSGVNAIFICADVTSTLLQAIITFGHQNNMNVIFRTTGSIKAITASQKKFLSLVHLFIHHSESNAQKLTNFFKHKYVIVDQAAHNEASLLRLPIKKDKPFVFGYLGRLSPEKGIDTLLGAIEVLHMDCKFIIAGDGPLGDKVNACAKKYDTVEAVGWIDVLSLSDFYNSIDCLIIPSLEESGPLVGIEALCASRLIITTRVGAMEERLKSLTKTFFFNLGDCDDLVNKIREVKNLNEEEVAQISQECRTLYEQKFSIQYVRERYREEVNKAMNDDSKKKSLKHL